MPSASTVGSGICVDPRQYQRALSLLDDVRAGDGRVYSQVGIGHAIAHDEIGRHDPQPEIAVHDRRGGSRVGGDRVVSDENPGAGLDGAAVESNRAEVFDDLLQPRFTTPLA